MLIATQGLVLHTIPNSESSVIAKIFTEKLGLRSYILKGVRKTGSHVKQNMLKPLSWLDMVVYDNPKTSINYIKEVSMANIPSHGENAVTNSILFFMDELLYRTLHEGEPMPQLFGYVTEQVKSLSDNPNPNPAMPISFLLTTAKLLGIAPLDNYSIQEPFFNLVEGRYVASAATENIADIVDIHLSGVLHNYLESVYGEEAMPIYPQGTRTAIINTLIDYYKIHVNYFGKFTSHEILHMVLA